MTGQEEAEFILLVSVTAPHSQSEPASIEESAPVLPPGHSLDSYLTLDTCSFENTLSKAVHRVNKYQDSSKHDS